MRKLGLVLFAVAVIAAGALVFVLPSNDGDTDSATRLRGIEATQDGRSTSWRLEVAGVDLGGVKVVGPVGNASPVILNQLDKTTGSSRPSDIVLDVDSHQVSALTVWINESIKGMVTRRSGALIGFDRAGTPLARFEFPEAVVAGLRMPFCESGSVAPATFRLTLRPSQLRPVLPTAKTPSKTSTPITQQGCSLTIPELDASKVAKVEGIGFSLVGDPFAVGGGASASKLVVSDFRVSFPDAAAKPWQDWFAHVNVRTPERTVTLAFLAPDLQNVGAQFELARCGVFKSEFAVADPAITTHAAELYCEQLLEIKMMSP